MTPVCQPVQDFRSSPNGPLDVDRLLSYAARDETDGAGGECEYEH